LDHKLRLARLELQRLASQYGLDALANVETKRRTMRGFKIAASAGGRAIAAVERRVAQLERRRSRLPHRVPVSQVVDGQVVRLATERKHLTNCLKMVAYQAEGELVRLIVSFRQARVSPTRPGHPASASLGAGLTCGRSSIPAADISARRARASALSAAARDRWCGGNSRASTAAAFPGPL
jgi:hypothetical protein